MYRKGFFRVGFWAFIAFCFSIYSPHGKYTIWFKLNSTKVWYEFTLNNCLRWPSSQTYVSLFFWSLYFLLLLKVFSFIVVKRILHFYLNYFKVYSSVVLSVVTLLWDRSPGLFHLANMKLLIKQQLPLSPSPPFYFLCLWSWLS